MVGYKSKDNLFRFTRNWRENMAEKKKSKPEDYPFYVRQIGTVGGIKGYDDESAAMADIKDRDERATRMGVKARYEAVVNE